MHRPSTLKGDKHQIIHDYLKQSGLPVLSNEDAESLETLISSEELLSAIKSLKPGKSPGPDSLTEHYYKTFTNILAAPLLRTLNFLMDP